MAEEATLTATPPDIVSADHVQVHVDEAAAAAVATLDDVTAPTDDATHAAIQSAAEAQQPVWNPATGQYYYPQVAEQGETYLPTADYSINGVMSLPGAEHYVTGDDYSGVAATLSNWAETTHTDDANSGLALVPPVNGDALAATNGDLSSPIVIDKPKKLVLACHFCRGRKLKCDGIRPTCGHCAKRNLSCTFDDHVRRRGPGKRTKEMRERAAREAEAAGLGLTADSLAHLAGEAGSSVIPDVTPKRPGRKRKSEAIDEAEKKARLDEEQAVAHAAVAAAAAAAQLGGHDDLGAHSLESLEALGSHDLVAHDDLGHGLNAHDALSAHDALGHDGMIDPALAGEGIDQNSTVLDLPPLEHSTLGQVIQSLNPAH